jgi:hypothetical protein
MSPGSTSDDSVPPKAALAVRCALLGQKAVCSVKPPTMGKKL